MKIRKFLEMFEDRYDYTRIIRILRKSHGWGMGALQKVDDFESDSEYFKNPIDDNDYVEQFHIYLTDLETGQMRGKFQNKSGLRVGKWQHGIQVARPVSIYNKLI
jgi:hypothetical protein